MTVLPFKALIDIFRHNRCAIVGSAPSGLLNEPGLIDSYDIVIRINNYKTKGIDLKGVPYDYSLNLGLRCDYHYSFYGGSIRKTADELKADGVKGHLCKCPNDECHVTKWHIANNQRQGGDFKPIYRRRNDFWFAPVYIPKTGHYMELFNALGKHVPTTGFACIWELSQCYADELYITGFDFFRSIQHNVDEMWNPGRQDDPIKHMPDAELDMFTKIYQKNGNINPDATIRKLLCRRTR